MKYLEYDDHNMLREQRKEITREDTVSMMEYIKRGYLPDYNYETGYNDDYDEVVLPDYQYPMHVAMSVAIEALEEIEKYVPDFFEKINAKYDR